MFSSEKGDKNTPEQQFSKCGQGTPGGGPWATFWERVRSEVVPEGSFHLSTLAPRWTVGGSRSFMVCDMTDWIQRQMWESTCLLLSQTGKFTKMWNSAKLHTNFCCFTTLLPFIKKKKKPNRYSCEHIKTFIVNYFKMNYVRGAWVA